jgi:hypothetical protein
MHFFKVITLCAFWQRFSSFRMPNVAPHRISNPPRVRNTVKAMVRHSLDRFASANSPVRHIVLGYPGLDFILHTFLN